MNIINNLPNVLASHSEYAFDITNIETNYIIIQYTINLGNRHRNFNI